MRKGIASRTQMVRMEHILLIKVLRRNDIFVMKLMIIFQQLVHRNRNYTKKSFQQLRRKGHCFQCLFPGEA